MHCPLSKAINSSNYWSRSSPIVCAIPQVSTTSSRRRRPWNSWRIPPLLASLPDFARVCALQNHIVTALKQLVCPQSAINGWVGLVMEPVMYKLLEPTVPFANNGNPGNFPVYTNFATKAVLKMIDKQFKLHQHQSSVLPHAWLQHCRPIQGVQHTKHDGKELINEHLLNHQEIGDIVW